MWASMDYYKNGVAADAAEASKFSNDAVDLSKSTEIVNAIFDFVKSIGESLS